jgi:tetratricopeptide (TPR) repeat protein
MQNKMSIEDLHNNTNYDIVQLFSGIDLEYIAKRRSTFRTIWEKFRENPSDLTAALRLIHAMFRVEQQEAIKNVLINPVVIGFAPLLLSLELEDKEEASETLKEDEDDDDDDADDGADGPSNTPGKEKASETLIKWKQFLFGEQKVNEGIEILENALKTGLDLPSIKSELYHSHYAWAQYEDPITKVKAKPSVRIEHLRRVMELGGTHDYIYKFMAEAYHENGDDEQARIHLSHAYKLNPELSGAIKISKALGFPQGTKPQSSAPKSSEYKYSKPAQIPSHEQIKEWKQKGEWNNILEYANPYDYFPKILPKARELLCQIADSLGSCADSKSIDALIVLLNFGYYWDVSFAAMTSLSKVGDEKVLAVLEKFEARTIGGRAILDESISYLKKRISYQTSSSNAAVTTQELLDQSKKAFFKDKNYQQARILLESLLPRIDKSDSKYLDVVIILARSCAETRDYGRAFELIKSIFSVLPEKYQKPLAQEMASWFWSDLGFREYSPASDSDYCFALQADIEAVLAEDDAGEALYKLKSLTRILEQLGAESSIDLIRTLIRTEAPGSEYVDYDRKKYIRKTNLSPVMKNFLTKFDEVIRTSVTEKIQKMLDGIELSDGFIAATITVDFDDDDDNSDDEEGDDDDFILESD